MNKTSRLVLYPILAFVFPTLLFAQDKNETYHLFHPVPKSAMRDMETDRPDVTESPFTVDAGHFQYEADLVRLEKERSESTSTRTLLINQANLKIGITRTTAIQIGFQTYASQEEKDLTSGQKTKMSGIGDLTFRVKQNILGNDGGNFILAFLPYIKFPTAKYTEDSKYEGGLIVPMQVKLAGEWKLGFQVEADRLKDKEENAMHTELLQSLTISHELFKHVDGIAETYYTYDFKQHQWANFLNAALQVDLLDDFKLDAGLNYGLQHDAAKNYYIGTAFRF